MHSLCPTKNVPTAVVEEGVWHILLAAHNEPLSRDVALAGQCDVRATCRCPTGTLIGGHLPCADSAFSRHITELCCHASELHAAWLVRHRMCVQMPYEELQEHKRWSACILLLPGGTAFGRHHTGCQSSELALCASADKPSTLPRHGRIWAAEGPRAHSAWYDLAYACADAL